MVGVASNAPRAAEVRHEVVKGFAIWRRERDAAALALAAEVEQYRQTVEAISAEVEVMTTAYRGMLENQHALIARQDVLERRAALADEEDSVLRTRVAFLEEAKRHPTAAHPHGRAASAADKAAAVRLFFRERIADAPGSSLYVGTALDAFDVWRGERGLPTVMPGEFVAIADGLGYGTARDRTGRPWFVVLQLVGGAK